jgi:PAS domain S-box-containing protein
MLSTLTELAVATGSRFFQTLADHLIVALGADFAAVRAVTADNPRRAVTLADSRRGGAENQLAYDLAEAELLNATPLARGPITRECAGNTWSGVLLTGSSGEAVGVLSVGFRQRPEFTQAIEPALRHFAQRAASEIEREQTAEAVRRSESRHQEMIRYAREGVWCLEFDPAIPLNLDEDETAAAVWCGRFAVANDATARMMGYHSAPQIVGRQLSEFATMLPYLESQFREHIRMGFGPRTLEFAVCRDGVESWWERSVLPIIASGKLLRFWGTTRDISERKSHEHEIHELNANLERLVADRSAQLEAANQELDAFSYSVSHDLRAAIQGILACSRIIVEDHGSQLNDAGRLWLTHMAEDAAQLDKLTMALLDLSLVSRAGLCRSCVDLSSMAESICQRLAATGPARKANFRIAPEIVVSADAALLRGVMENLLGNAWKFTKTRETTEIEVGVMAAPSQEPVYFVRDNGVGFNMKYADKLFGAFQRLHRSEEFEGNGIGLATVRRVIHRHGGRVRAEAQPDRGATFFFTLGKSDTR